MFWLAMLVQPANNRSSDFQLMKKCTPKRNFIIFHIPYEYLLDIPKTQRHTVWHWSNMDTLSLWLLVLLKTLPSYATPKYHNLKYPMCFQLCFIFLIIFPSIAPQKQQNKVVTFHLFLRYHHALQSHHFSSSSASHPPWTHVLPVLMRSNAHQEISPAFLSPPSLQPPGVQLSGFARFMSSPKHHKLGKLPWFQAPYT